MRITRSAVILSVLLLTHHALPQSRNWEWKTFTSTREIYDMTMIDSCLWCATEGGLLLYDVVSHTHEAWTNTEGLAAVHVTSLCRDQSDNLWIGTRDGYLQKFDLQNRTWTTFSDYTDFAIYDLEIHGDTLLVALDIGISAYLISRQEVKETYKHLGESIEAEIPVYKIFTKNNELHAITDQGLVSTQLTHPNLLDPHFWQNSSPGMDIAGFQIKSMAFFRQALWLGTSEGVYRQQETGDWEKVPGTDGILAVEMKVHEDRLLLLTDKKFIQYDGTTFQTIASDLPGGLSLTSLSESCYIGTLEGIYIYDQNQFSGSLLPDGPGSNFFSDLEIDHEGALWCCSSDFSGSSGHGFFKFSENQWRVFNKSNTENLETDLAVCLAVDQNNRKWIGTWGRGAYVLENDSIVSHYRPENGYLAGAKEDNTVYPNYAVVKDIVVDFNGTVWLLNRQAYNGLALVSVTEDNVWTYYGSADGISDTFLWDITVDQYNRKWIGSSVIAGQGYGAYIYNDNWTPSDKSDDSSQNLSQNDGLLSENVQALAVDDNNIVWLGTNEGLNYFTGSEILEQYDLSSVNIQTMLVDGANNLWVGTNAGLHYYSYETYKWTTFNQENSDLVNNDIISLAMDLVNGYIYIGTIQGLSRLKTPFSEPKEAFSSLKIFPNPYIVRQHGTVSIENLARDVTVSVFSSQGYLVYQKPNSQVHGNAFLWDGTDSSGNPVPGGIYIVTASNQSGEKSIGKIAVIR